jgi:hypothetical protein
MVKRWHVLASCFLQKPQEYAHQRARNSKPGKIVQDIKEEHLELKVSAVMKPLESLYTIFVGYGNHWVSGGTAVGVF